MSGLLDRQTWKCLPLRSSSIFVEIKGFTARTTAILTYYNDSRTEIEGLFVLPLEHASAIVEFESVIQGHYIFADVKNISELQSKNVLFENEEMQDGIFNVSVGKISPWILIEIQVTIVCEVSVMFYGDALQYTLPQSFSPKVVNTIDDMKQAKKLSAISTLGYSFQLELLIEAPCLLCGVQSNTHPIQVDAPSSSKSGSKLRISLPEDFQPTDAVFELLMFLCRPREPYIIIEEAKEQKGKGEDKNPISNIMNNPILMLSYSPEISNFRHEIAESNLNNQVGEFILMIDCSTAMNVHLNNSIKEACTLFIKSLPTNCFFNVASFSTRCDSVFTTSRRYSSSNADIAHAYVMSLHGFTETSSLFHVLQWVCTQDDILHVPRQVFIITTGTIKYSYQVLELIRKKHHVARYFTFSMGSSNSTGMLETVSVISRGKCYVIEDGVRPHEQIMMCLKAALQPAITNLKVSWILPDAYDVIYTPENLPSLFLGDRLNLYAILANKETDKTATEKPGSINSIKEFWFEDFDLFDEFIEKHSSHDLLTEETTEINTPSQDKDQCQHNENDETNVIQNVDKDNEVFLTEEEASQLRNNNGWQKHSSLDRVQTWRVSKFPENTDIDGVFDNQDKGQFDYNETERMYLQQQTSGGYRRDKSSSDGIDSIGSSNSYSSNVSSGSHFLAFPGYPTRLSTCRSIETRSPHVPKHTDDQTSYFPFTEYTKERHLSTERIQSNQSENTVIKDSDKNVIKHEAQHKGRQKLTQALLDEQVNTHLIDPSNESVIERLLESIIAKKRQKLTEWVNLQEEMTQCTWPPSENDRKITSDQSAWRDSGIGHRSSSEPRTSDLEEESVNVKKSGQFSKSSSGYFDTEEINDYTGDEKLEKSTIQKDDNDLRYIWPTRNTRSLSVDEEGKKTCSEGSKKASSKEYKKASGEKSSTKKKFRPKNMWNLLVDKVRTLTTAVSDRSGETNFKMKEDIKIPEHFKSFTGIIEGSNSIKSGNKQNITGLSTKPQSRDDLTHKFDSSLSLLLENKKSNTDGKNIRSRQRYIRNRPLIENSRTISTSSMFEIGQSEIGDVDNLHLLPSHALIYLSGQFGQRAFKRIIPFQLIFTESKNGASGDVTVHQLAAKSIIRDLEIQMDQDEMLVNSGRDYIKTLIGEVSKSAHILSKYTALVTIDEKFDDDQIISISKHNEEEKSCKNKQILKDDPFVINIESKQPSVLLNQQEVLPFYEIHSKKRDNDTSCHDTKVWHTKLMLKVPQHTQHNMLSIKPSSNTSTIQKRLYEKTSYMKIIDLMTSGGSWELTHSFAEVMTINFSQLRESCPFADPILKSSNQHYEHIQLEIYEHIWATCVALTWLRTYCMEFQSEWLLTEKKANQWLVKQKLPKGFLLEDVLLISQQNLKILNCNSRRGSNVIRESINGKSSNQ